MNLKTLIFICILSSWCDHTGETFRYTKQQNNFDWIIGQWVRTNDRPDLKTYENWVKHSEHEYHGKGFTIKGADTVFQEGLKLVKISGDWKYIVTGVNESPTDFHLIVKEKNKFIAESLKNDFPKKLTYSRLDDTLTAVASADQKKVIFKFERLDQK